MELLAPAGGFQQALVSIKNGCDALYGGLKKWSARSRALNLSNEEYCELMKICREKNIRFYLTLNTLMSDEEIQDIIAFFSEENRIFPDGVLVGDIGLLSSLKKFFPNLNLHASTQFGAYSAQDVKFFSQLGMTRVVVARELTLKEIAYIKNNTDVEIEVFVYGNQCVIFSGNCLWGGLTHSGSGHKGCCIGTCNDIFQTETGRMGDFFWINNIGLFGWVKELEDIGVDSIKIEGRVRPNNEVATVVSKFRAAINGEKIENDYGYDGYLGGSIPPKGMINDFNPENTHKHIENVTFTEYDYMLCEDENGQHFVMGSENDSKEYVYTVFKNNWFKNGINIRVRFDFETTKECTVVIAIEYVRVNGTKIKYGITKTNNEKVYALKDLFHTMEKIINANIYECKAKIPAMSEVYVDEEQLNSICKNINEDISKVNISFVEDNMDFVVSKEHDLIFIDNVDDLTLCYEKGFRNFIYKVRTLVETKQCLTKEDELLDTVIFYQLPYLDFNKAMGRIYPLLKNRRVMITRISQLSLCKQYYFKEIYGDYMLNVWNAESARWLKEQGISAIIAHPEVPLKSIEKIAKTSGLEIIVIGASKIPFGYSRACFKYNNLCQCKCTKQNIELHNKYKGNDVQMLCDNEFGYRTIFDPDYYVAQRYVPGQRYVWGLFGLADEQKKEILVGEKKFFEDKEKIYIDGYYTV